MAGGDVEGLIEKAPEHRLSLEQAIDNRGIRLKICYIVQSCDEMDDCDISDTTFWNLH